MIYSNQNAVSYGNQGPLLSPSGGNTVILGTKICPLATGGSMGCLYEGSSEPWTTLSGPSGLPLSSTLVVSRANPRPGCKMGRGRKPAHVCSYLRQYHLCYPPAHPWNAQEKLYLPLKRGELTLSIASSKKST